MAQPVTVQGQIMDEAPPAEAPPAEAPPAEAPPAETAAAEEAAVAGAMDPAVVAAVPAGVGPGAAMVAPVAEACASPCPNAECTLNGGMGCYKQLGVPPAVTFECSCPPPPPPPIVGSDAWLHSDEQNMVDPGPEAAAAGPNLAMYEAGNVAVNLNAYLKASADKVKTQAQIEGLIYKVLWEPCSACPRIMRVARTLRACIHDRNGVVSNSQDLAAVSKANGGGEAGEAGEAGEPGETPAPGILCGYTGLMC
jgi:hypothetical protein